MLYKSKFEHLSLEEIMNEIIDHLHSLTKRWSPNCLHKLMFKCDQSEMVPVRRALSIPIGIGLGWFIQWGIVANFPFRPSLSLWAQWGMVSVVTLGFVISVQVRAVLLLIVPTLLSGMFLSFFYCLLFKEIFLNILIKQLANIILGIAKMLSCFFSFRK